MGHIPNLARLGHKRVGGLSEFRVKMTILTDGNIDFRMLVLKFQNLAVTQSFGVSVYLHDTTSAGFFLCRTCVI